MYSIYVVATGQHVGKTTMSLGLVPILKDLGFRVRFFKPVGQQYVQLPEGQVDRDSVLMRSIFDLDGALKDMSPVTVPRGFVEHYLFNREPEKLRKQIMEAFERLSKDCDVLVVEGTGHAGVGSCLDLSNAEVASMLNAEALLIAEGGVGSTLDRVSLNMGLFDRKGVKMLGVVINKVYAEKLLRLKKSLKQGLHNLGLDFLGIIPYEKKLTFPRVGQIARRLKAQVLCGEEALDETRVEHILVAAMEPENLLPRIEPHSLMITPGDRIDNILVALNSGVYGGLNQGSVGAILLTGGLVPDLSIIELMRNSKLPVLLCKGNTYPVASKVHNMVHKILPRDTDKIELARRFVNEHVDIDAIAARIRKVNSSG